MLEVIEPDGLTTIQISNTGATSVLHSVGEEEQQQDSQEQKERPVKYFYCRGKEALQFHSKETGQQLLDDIEQDQHCAVVYQVIPAVFAFTSWK